VALNCPEAHDALRDQRITKSIITLTPTVYTAEKGITAKSIGGGHEKNNSGGASKADLFISVCLGRFPRGM
jgi:hypothetical protein